MKWSIRNFSESWSGRHAFPNRNLEKEWMDFKLKYGKKYQPEEEKTRMEIFMKNTGIINEHNEAYDRGQRHFKINMNEYGDMSDIEFGEAMNGFRGYVNGMSENNMMGATCISPANLDIPEESVERERKVVPALKNRDISGSHWAPNLVGKWGYNPRYSGDTAMDFSNIAEGRECKLQEAVATKEKSFAGIDANAPIIPVL